MDLQGEQLRLRPWKRGDEEALVRHANDREIWRNLTDRFPHPYTRADADAWISLGVSREGPPGNFAVILDNEPVGSVGYEAKGDIYSRTAEVGYWIARAFQGRGLATEALGLLTTHLFARFPFVRIEASVIDWNPASCRVLEKAGYTFESRQRARVFKDGRIADALIYVRFRDGYGPSAERDEPPTAGPDGTPERPAAP